MEGTCRATPAATAASPLQTSKKAAPASGGIPWLLRKRTGKVALGAQEERSDVDDDVEDGGFAVSTPSPADAVAAGGTPEPARKRREALARLRSAVLAVVARARRRRGRRSMGSSVTGTIFGRRRGRVHLALQTDPRAPPALMVELSAYSTDALVREMSSGLVRIALECQKTPAHAGNIKLTRREAADGAGRGADLASVLQRAQVRVRCAEGVRRGGVAGAESRRARLRRRGRCPGRRRRRRGPYVHEGQVREVGGIQGLGSLLHDKPRRQRRARAQHLSPQSLRHACIMHGLVLCVKLCFA
ncbi:unnamed protein product [Alopecurus aequalis]